jgi:Protein-L-isoaspartate(D-aspartate) O-methyltransferase (PCMT)
MMVGPEGRVVGIEHIPELVAASVENVKRSAAASLLEKGSLTLHVAGMQIPKSSEYSSITGFVKILKMLSLELSLPVLFQSFLTQHYVYICCT